MEFGKTRWSCSWNSDQNCTQNLATGWGEGGWGGGGSYIRTKVKSLKIDIAERTRNCEILLLKITCLNIIVENHKDKRNSFGKTNCLMSFCQV